MNAPQIIVIVIFSIRLAVNTIKEGEPRPPKHNKYSTASELAHIALWVGLLWWGGFWK